MVGASGSGKSTLLNILGGLDVPSAGRAVVAGHQLDRAEPRREQTRYLRQVIGFVWQQTARNLLPYLSALENVALPMVFDGVSTHDAERAGARAARPGRPGRPRRPSTRPAVRRRAAAGRHRGGAGQPAGGPPRGRADRRARHDDAGTRSSSCFRRLNRELGVTIVVATHDPLVSDAGQPDGRHPRRPGQQRDAAPADRVRRGRPSRRSHRVRGARPGRPAAAAAGACRGPRARATACASSSRTTTSGSGRTGRSPMPGAAATAGAARDPAEPRPGRATAEPGRRRRPEPHPRRPPDRAAPTRQPPRRRHSPGRSTVRSRTGPGRPMTDPPPMVETTGALPRLPDRLGRRPCAARRRPAGRARRARRGPRPVGLRQDDPAVAHRRARPADDRARRSSTAQSSSG